MRGALAGFSRAAVAIAQARLSFRAKRNCSPESPWHAGDESELGTVSCKSDGTNQLSVKAVFAGIVNAVLRNLAVNSAG